MNPGSIRYRMIYGEASLPEVVASENFRTGDLFALFEELAKKRFSSGYDNLNFGEEGPGAPARDRVSLRGDVRGPDP